MMSDATRQRARRPLALMMTGTRSLGRVGSFSKHPRTEEDWEAEFRAEVRKKILMEIEDRESTVGPEEAGIPVVPPADQQDAQPQEPNIFIWVIIGAVIFAIFVFLVQKMMA